MAYVVNDVAVTNSVVNLQNCCCPRNNFINQNIFNGNIYRNCTGNVAINNLNGPLAGRVSANPISSGLGFVTTLPPAVSSYSPALNYAVASNIAFNGSPLTSPFFHTASSFNKQNALIADRAFNGNCGLRTRHYENDLRAYRAAVNNVLCGTPCLDYYGGPIYPLDYSLPNVYNHGIPYYC
ncbi:hypothetical protein QJ854_gp739 [Moumouvirus goulette]|uniref:Uncharacterized protein n=1 Tax=Moumouvirus goulette TaxID=1247379 RepID=M1PGD1_9VIRU|nr:hypothetical protein QJ854_gp739 [Moumouvirus goulette]AGF85043.1 hypothetical protein glt_00234 [Moumouvirus goulette]